MSSRLDLILTDDNHEIQKIDIKLLVLELYRESLEEGNTFAEVGELFRTKVEEL